MMLVTLAEAKDHLRVDDNDQDAQITLYVQAASRTVLNYINVELDWLDTAGEPAVDTAGEAQDVPSDVKSATLLLLGMLFRDRDGEYRNDWQFGYLPFAVTALLYQYHDPSVA